MMNSVFAIWPIGGRRRNAGLTLIELMISMAVSLFIIGAVLYVVFDSRTSYRYNEAVSRVQENGRVATQILAHELRMAGYFGCFKARDVIAEESLIGHVNVIAAPSPVAVLTAAQAIQGATYNAGSPAFVGPDGVAGSSVISITKGSSSPVQLAANLAATTADIVINGNPDRFDSGDVLLITDCRSADLFRASAVIEGPTDVFTITRGAGNSTSALSRPYTDSATVMALRQQDYFVRATGRQDAAGQPVFALFERVNGQVSELVEGVEDMRLRFGVDTSGNSVANVYRTEAQMAVDDWPDVVSVRVELLVSSVEDRIVAEDVRQTLVYLFDGVARAATDPSIRQDNRFRQVFETTVAIRNRLN